MFSKPCSKLWKWNIFFSWVATRSECHYFLITLVVINLVETRPMPSVNYCFFDRLTFVAGKKNSEMEEDNFGRNNSFPSYGVGFSYSEAYFTLLYKEELLKNSKQSTRWIKMHQRSLLNSKCQSLVHFSWIKSGKWIHFTHEGRENFFLHSKNGSWQHWDLRGKCKFRGNKNRIQVDKKK